MIAIKTPKAFIMLFFSSDNSSAKTIDKNKETTNKRIEKN